ncbi:hypothetical protein GUJ93_ZPchr0014g47670 [Zizania palustris]|uniref:Uncharacterized protein n=1 Tax=Zizania palustris TaxID=103762 RepID=A0A8J5VRQ7_ZIZPA|nr:hypothetical protein GUJ93_ZPchr0014g47670 [Zizania palustris]
MAGKRGKALLTVRTMAADSAEKDNGEKAAISRSSRLGLQFLAAWPLYPPAVGGRRWPSFCAFPSVSSCRRTTSTNFSRFVCLFHRFAHIDDIEERVVAWTFLPPVYVCYGSYFAVVRILGLLAPSTCSPLCYFQDVDYVGYVLSLYLVLFGFLCL